MSTIIVSAVSSQDNTTPLIINSGNTLAGSIKVESSNSNIQINGNMVVTGNTLSVNGNNVSPVQSFRNKIINGNFDFWQRGTSSSTAGYLSDRWITSNVTSTFTSSRQSFTLGQTDVPNEPTYFHRTIVSSVAGVGAFCVVVQKVESVRTLASQTATLSFWAKADASKNMAVEFTQQFGTGGSPSAAVADIGVTTCALTTSWQKFTITVNIPSISGKTLGSDNNDYMQAIFWLDAGSNFNSRTNSLGQQSGTFDIAQVQLEAGPVATPFEVRPMGTELALCQRYYEVFGYTMKSAVNYYIPYSYKATKRATPTLTLVAGSLNSGTIGGTAYNPEQAMRQINASTSDVDAQISASAEL